MQRAWEGLEAHRVADPIPAARADPGPADLLQRLLAGPGPEHQPQDLRHRPPGARHARVAGQPGLRPPRPRPHRGRQPRLLPLLPVHPVRVPVPRGPGVRPPAHRRRRPADHRRRFGDHRRRPAGRARGDILRRPGARAGRVPAAGRPGVLLPRAPAERDGAAGQLQPRRRPGLRGDPVGGPLRAAPRRRAGGRRGVGDGGAGVPRGGLDERLPAAGRAGPGERRRLRRPAAGVRGGRAAGGAQPAGGGAGGGGGGGAGADVPLAAGGGVGHCDDVGAGGAVTGTVTVRPGW